MTAIGIDLGTTNSAVATYDPDRDVASVLVNSDGNALTPSVVGLRERNGQRSMLIGRPALNWAKREPKDTILSVKRLMGRDYADEAVALARSRMSYRIVAGEGDDPRAHVMIGDDRYSPAQVSTMILKKLKEDAARRLGTGNEPSQAVITVPAYFKEAQRAATRQAGEQAGLTVKRIIDEPTAAAIAYGLELKAGDQRQVLVYDLGGGTFDISILNAVRDDEDRNHFQVLSFLGDNWLGGDDFDMLVVDRAIEWVRENAGTDPSGDLGFLFNAKQHAEAAKKELSQQDEVDIIIPAATRGDGAALVDVDFTLTRDEFEAMIEPLVDKTLDLVRAALEEQNLTAADISDVLLVGGSTLVPKVYRSVENFFGHGKVRRNVNPMECVALGAGILARTLSGVQCASCGAVNEEDATECTGCAASLATARPTGSTEIYDVTGQALGIAAVDGGRADVFVPIIARNTPYPLSEPSRRSFEATDGKVIRVPVYEGDDPVASRNAEQGVIEYHLEEEIDRRTRVEVAFNFDANRILQVTITVPGTGMQHNVELRTDQPRVAPAQAMALDDEDGQSAREDLMVIQDVAKRFLRQYQEYMDPMQVTKIREHLDQAQQALVFSEKESCKRMTNLLQSDIFGSGLASQLYIADRVAEQATSDDAREIHTAVASVREAYRLGRKDVLQDQQQVLRMMVAQVRQRSDVQEISDAEEFAGLLRTIDGH